MQAVSEEEINKAEFKAQSEIKKPPSQVADYNCVGCGDRI
jgi:hypothetical protein